jgi:hypothetical protein
MEINLWGAESNAYIITGTISSIYCDQSAFHCNLLIYGFVDCEACPGKRYRSDVSRVFLFRYSGRYIFRQAVI